MYHDLFEELNKLYSGDGEGETSDITPTGMTLGVVVDTDDPLQMGRLRVFCPALNDNPKKIQHLPWALYISPFGGSINNKGYTRGNDPDNCTTDGAVQYGFWAIPEQGAHVLVGCIDGDTRRRFWIGCAYEHQETHGALTGRWKWNGGSGLPDGPLSSTNSPVQPQAANLKKAFTPSVNVLGVDISLGSGNNSREWRTRAAEYQVCGVREDVGQPPNTNKTTYLDEQYDKVSQAEPDAWVKPIVGANGYDWSGYKSLGSFMASRVYGMSSPGFHSFMMDDRAFNSRVKIRSSAGHQIILDDTNERIYINTYEGNSWIELDKSGNIDIYAKRRLSVHAEKDINLMSDETVRILGKKGIHLYAGYNQTQDNLLAPPQDGEIRIQSEADMHVITKKNYRHLSFADTLWEVGGKVCETVGKSMFLQVQNELDVLTNTGDINITSSKNYNLMVNGNINTFAEGTMSNASKGNAQMFSFDGKMDLGSQLNMNVKSMSQDVTMEAVGGNSGKTGGVFQKSPESQAGVSSSGIMMSTNKDIKHKAAQNIQMSNAVPTKQNPPNPPSNIGDCSGGPTPPIPLDGLTGADLAAAAAYNAGFRGDALATAVAIAGAESTWKPGAVGDTSLANSKWGPSVGMWQVRTLNNPGAYSGADALRNQSTIGGSSNANIQNNANAAFALSNGGTNFQPWSTFTSGAYQQDQYSFEAKRAANAVCNPGGGAGSGASAPSFEGKSLTTPQDFSLVFGASNSIGSCVTSLIEECLLNDILAIGNHFLMGSNNVSIQSLTDIAVKGALASTQIFGINGGGLYSKLQEQILAHNLLGLSTGLGFAAGLTGSTHAMAVAAAEVVAAVGALQGLINAGPAGVLAAIASQFLKSLGLNFLVGDLCSLHIPQFGPLAMNIFFSANFDLQVACSGATTPSFLAGTTIGFPGSSGSISSLLGTTDTSGGDNSGFGGDTSGSSGDTGGGGGGGGGGDGTTPTPTPSITPTITPSMTPTPSGAA